MDKASLASAARQAFVAGNYDQSLSSLASLKSTVASADDVQWVEDNIADVEQMATNSANKPAPPTGVFPRIRGVKWRVDVAISTSHLERVMRPSVMVELALSDGTLKTFEVRSLASPSTMRARARR